LTTTPAPAATTDRPARAQLETMVGARGLLQMTVFFGHVCIAYVFAREISDAGLRYLAAPAESVLSLFFMFSGFVLTWVARPGEPKRRFWRRRLVKIFPNHIVTWTAGLVLMLAFGVFTSWAEVLPSLFLVHNWIPVPGVLAGTNGPNWSLTCELFMYATFPFLHAWSQRLDAARLWRWLVGTAVGIVVMTAVVGLTVPSEPKAFGQPLSAYQFYVLIFHPLARLPEFVIGILIARLVITGQWRPVRVRWILLTFGIGYLISLTLPAPLGFVAPFVPALILAVGAAATADINGSRSVFTRRSAMWLGERSFALYVVHGNVLIYSRKVFGEGPYPTPYAVLWTAGCFAVSIVLAHFLFTRVENPMMRRFARPRRRPQAEPATAAAAQPAPATQPAQAAQQ
jgi:peptidoglycan/LPS O-acetylase OafA/YrhL